MSIYGHLIYNLARFPVFRAFHALMMSQYPVMQSGFRVYCCYAVGPGDPGNGVFIALLFAVHSIDL